MINYNVFLEINLLKNFQMYTTMAPVINTFKIFEL